MRSLRRIPIREGESGRLSDRYDYRLLEVSTSGYYAWRHRQPSARKQEDAELTGLVRRFHAASGGIYGACKIHQVLPRAMLRDSPDETGNRYPGRVTYW